jgi:hypothetical protein
MIIDVGVRSVVLDCLLEGFKRLGSVAQFHVYTGYLDPALSQRWFQPHRLFEVSFGTIGVPN